MGDALPAIRARYAERVCRAADARNPALVAAFTEVPRERFLPAGPWTIYGGGQGAQVTPDANPRHLYQDVLVAIDRARGINNGEPRLWASVFDQLRIATGERVLHVGAGTGYYTAILAELVGKTGAVTGVEIAPDLAALAQAALTPWPQARILCGNGTAMTGMWADGSVDVIVANAGMTDIPALWLDALADGGRLAIPLTLADRTGFFLGLQRRGAAFNAWFLTGVAIIDCVGGRSMAGQTGLAAALETGRLLSALSLHRQSVPDESCVLAGADWWLSSRRV